ncbi:hypothetical protein Pcinc_002709 [Petrolisthes cinctipes]|uniref:Uncharacterized protein n=1 Tax=Petrolisthes cinctipes TaxID=88211 RepID=A0AAE1GIQ8_PETCI|nr:hypothetical protein Pcinc_002709 [Petrolisthes cinctipes]
MSQIGCRNHRLPALDIQYDDVGRTGLPLQKLEIPCTDHLPPFTTPPSPSVSHTIIFLTLPVMEMFQECHRSAAGIIVFLPWTFSMMMLGGLAYLYRNWRYLVLTTSLPLLLLLPLQWFIDESPRWLIVRGNHDRALQVLQKAARWNNTSLPPEHQLRKLMTDITEESYKMSGDENVVTLIKHFFVHFSMLFSFDPYIYCTLSGVVEIPGATLTIPFVNVLGRRLSNIICMSSTGIFILAIAFIPKSMGWLMMLLALIGKMTIAAAFQIIYLHVSEVFPTEVRTRGAGLGDMMAKVGSMTAPFIIDSLHAVWEPAHAAVVGCSGFLACIAIYLLPETKGAALHDTVASLEAGSPNVRLLPPFKFGRVRRLTPVVSFVVRKEATNMAYSGPATLAEVEADLNLSEEEDIAVKHWPPLKLQTHARIFIGSLG